MKKIYHVLWAIILVGAGCAPHFHRIKGDQVHLYLKAPKAQSVCFVSSLDGFKPHAVDKTAQGMWVYSLSVSKEFNYFYLVDGEVYCPPCKCYEQDDFGASNCIFNLDL